MGRDQERSQKGSSKAAFTQGSTLTHIITNTSMASVGLMTLFVVDLVDLYFLSLLGEVEIAAAIGYAGTILFFTTSICIGIAISVAALVARAVGAEELERARRYVLHFTLLILILSTPVAVLVWFYVPELVSLIGAEGKAHEFAVDYLSIIVPSMPVLALAMAGGGVLRATSAPKWAMASTVAGGLINAILDPIFIFGLNMHVEGAALASVMARFGVLAIALYGVVRVQDMVGSFAPKRFAGDCQRFFSIALPAIATNFATPVGNVVVIRAIAEYGESVVAGYAIIGRVSVVAFGMVFALSGAIGPIIGQNFGADKIERVRKAFFEGMLFAAVMVSFATLVMYLFKDAIASAFNTEGEARSLLLFFITYVGILFTFSGIQFVSNATFNNLGKPLWSTCVNWGRATVGTIPFVWAGSYLGGAEGILLGQAVGGILAGGVASLMAIKLINDIDPSTFKEKQPIRRKLFATPVSALTNYFGWVPSSAALVEEDRGNCEKRTN